MSKNLLAMLFGCFGLLLSPAARADEPPTGTPTPDPAMGTPAPTDPVPTTPELAPTPAPETTSEAEPETAVRAKGRVPGVGAMGIGMARIPSGLTGIEFEYYLGKIMIDLVLGLDFYSPSEGDSQTMIGFGGGAFFALRQTDQVNLSFGGRLVVARGPHPGFTGGEEEDATQFNVEAPMRVQYYFHPNISVHFEVAAIVQIIGEHGAVLRGSSNASLLYSFSEGTAILIGVPTVAGLAGITAHWN